MYHDLRDDGNPVTIETDLAIIGAGAAGISIAHALIDSGIDCALVESGGEQADPAIQSLCDTESVGLGDGQSCRLRYLGGTTNHWGGWCAPLNAIDFQVRPWMPHSGWPIGQTELDPFHDRAQQLCGLANVPYAAAQVTDDPRQLEAFRADKLVPRMFHISDPPQRFGSAFRRDLERARNVHLYVNANISKLIASDNASEITQAMIRTLDGRHGIVRARRFVLACGAIENARLLLVSNDAATGGVGNDHDLVGRFFMQHPHIDCAELLAAVPEQVAGLFQKFSYSGQPMRCSVGPSADAQRTLSIANCSATVHAVTDTDSGYGASRSLWADLSRGRWPDEFASKLWTVITDLGSVTGEATMWVLRMRSEQSPNPDSRITLSDEVDRLGIPKARIDWRLSAFDQRTVRRAARLIGEEFGRLNWGRLRLKPWLLDDQGGFPQDLWGGCHHIGTTRMADDPRHGVVDRHCRVHGVANLYIAGSSVFPTAGYANPTLSIVALSLRLAAHLRQQTRA